MNFFSFATRAFLLSFAVALFWLPVLAIVFYGVYIVFGLMAGEFIGLVMIIVLLYYPLQMLLLVLAVRGGMTVLKVTSGSDIAKLLGVTWRALRFSGVISFVIVNVIGLLTVITGLKFLRPNFIQDYWHIQKTGGIAKEYLREELLNEYPVILALGGTFGLCLAVALFAVNFAASAAMAVDNPPGHHTIWGIGAQFSNIFFLGILFMFIPHFVVIFLIGGISTTWEQVNAAPSMVLAIYGAYTTWTICLLAAAAALGYKLHLVDDEVRREHDIAEMTGTARDSRPAVDLAALRKARMGGVVSVDPYALGDDDDEEDE